MTPRTQAMPYRPNRRRQPVRRICVLTAAVVVGMVPAGAAYFAAEGMPMKPAPVTGYTPGYPKTWGNAPAKVPCPKCSGRGTYSARGAGSGDLYGVFCDRCKTSGWVDAPAEEPAPVAPALSLESDKPGLSADIADAEQRRGRLAVAVGLRGEGVR